LLLLPYYGAEIIRRAVSLFKGVPAINDFSSRFFFSIAAGIDDCCSCCIALCIIGRSEIRIITTSNGPIQHFNFIVVSNFEHGKSGRN
jgi:hypothetical protein